MNQAIPSTKTRGLVATCVLLLLSLTEVEAQISGDREKDLRLVSLSAGFGFPEYLNLGARLQCSRYVSLGLQFSKMIIGQDQTNATGELACAVFPCGLISATGLGTSMVYYLSRQNEPVGFLKLPNSLEVDASYVFPSQQHGDGIMLNALFQSEDISQSGFTPYLGLGVSFAKASGLHSFVCPLVRMGIAFNIE